MHYPYTASIVFQADPRDGTEIFDLSIRLRMPDAGTAQVEVALDFRVDLTYDFTSESDDDLCLRMLMGAGIEDFVRSVLGLDPQILGADRIPAVVSALIPRF